ncbi:hypothetical protein D3C81_1957790 [compost metagenome]
MVAHGLGDPPGQLARGIRVVAQAEHHQRAPQPQEAQADAALGARLGLLLGQRPERDVQHVVQHARGHPHDLGEGLEVKR